MKPSAVTEIFWVRCVLLAIAFAYIGVLVLLPVVAVFVEALPALKAENMRDAICLTLILAIIVFVSKHLFRWFLRLIDAPFSISPVISRLINLLVFLPVFVAIAAALRDGGGAYFEALNEENARAAIKLTLLVAAIAVPLNLVFGVVASWAIAKFEFAGKRLLITFIDLPFSVSPVISGLIYVLLFGSHSMLGRWLIENDMQVIFAVPGLVIATIFVTFPFVARELIPLMEEQGTEEEEAAIMLGAGGLRTFFAVTLPNIKWALLYGVLLCNARAMGEFGAVSVVSGHIKGETNTIPLHVEILYNEYNFAAAFAVASVLTLLALVTLLLKTVIEHRFVK